MKKSKESPLIMMSLTQHFCQFFKTTTFGIFFGSGRFLRSSNVANFAFYFLFSFFINVESQAQTGPSGYTFLGTEGQTVQLSQKSDVAYGANGIFTYKYDVTGSVTINTTTFGGDPVPNVLKSAFYRVATVKPATPEGFIYMAPEGGSFQLTQYADIAYGANGIFAYKYGVSGNIEVNTSTFGQDPVPNVVKAGFYRYIPTPPQGPAGYSYLRAEGQTATLTERTNVAYGANGSYSYRYGIIGDVTFSTSTFGDPAPEVAKAGFYKPYAIEPTTELTNAISEVQKHLAGAIILSEAQLNTYRTLLRDQMYRIENDTNLIKQAKAVITSYDTKMGAFFTVSRTKSLPRDANDGKAIDRCVFEIQQGLHDALFNGFFFAKSPKLVDGFKYVTASYFPGDVAAPSDPNVQYSVKIKASLAADWGIPTLFSRASAKRPTGCYVAPGSIATVTVPASMVGKGFQVLVGCHTWEKSVKATMNRFDRVTATFPITSTETKVANPFGGSIYIVVPYLANEGVVDIQFKNVVRSPFFSATPHRTTTLTEWQMTERKYLGKWADFESEQFMMTVPTSWIYNYSDPVTLMKKWDTAMQGVSDMLGYPTVRNNVVLYLQPDLSVANPAYSPGYPQVNTTYVPDAATNGNSTIWWLVDPMKDSQIDFHELGHGQKFSMFPGYGESAINAIHAYANGAKFGKTADEALKGSWYEPVNMTRDQTAINWMVRDNFRAGNSMGTSLNSPNDEVSYKIRGHAYLMEIAALFGWNVIHDFHYAEQLAHINNTPGDGLSVIDSRILRFSKAAGYNLTPLFHFWGVHPDNWTALKYALTAAGVYNCSKAIYDRLLYYKTIVPKDNAQFLTHYNTIYPTPPLEDIANDYVWYNGMKTSYGTTQANQATTVVQSIVDLYYQQSCLTDVVNVAPTISITAPANGTTITAGTNITLTASASDVAPGTVSSVSFYDGAVLLGTDIASPYSFTWTGAAVGSHVVTAKATDNNGAVTTSASVTITVNAAPTVNITAPLNGTTVISGTNITLTASASDVAPGTVSSVAFYDGATLLSTDNVAPYSFTWTGAAVGSHVVTAKATDNNGAVTTSTGVTITVTAIVVTDPLTLSYFLMKDVLTKDYMRPTSGSATATITQYEEAVQPTLDSYQWEFKAAAGGYYYIINKWTKKAIQPTNALVTENTSLSQVTFANQVADEVLWSILPTGGGYYWIKNKKSGLYIRPFNATNGGQGTVAIVQNTLIAGYSSFQWELLAVVTKANAREFSEETENTSTDNTFKIYPNPASDLINLSIETPWELMDLSGVTLLSGNGKQINSASLSSGVYLIKANGQAHKLSIVK